VAPFSPLAVYKISHLRPVSRTARNMLHMRNSGASSDPYLRARLKHDLGGKVAPVRSLITP